MLEELLSPELWRSLSLVLMNLALAGLSGSALLQLKASGDDLRPFRRRAMIMYFTGLGLNLLATAMVFAGTGLLNALPLLDTVLLETQSGKLMWLELAGGVLMAGSLNPSLSPALSRLTGLSGFVLAVWARAATGHAGVEGWLTTAVAVHALHIAAACSWAGLVLAWLWLGPDRAETQPPAFRRHLSETALLCLMAVAFTGLADALRMVEMHDRSAFLETEYAGLLLIKVALVLAAAALGGFNRLFVMPLIESRPAATGRFYGVALTEGCLLLMVLMLAATLANTTPG